VNRWSDDDAGFWLVTPHEFTRIPDGTTLHCIDGKTYVKGVDVIDCETRFGHMAFGIRQPEYPELFTLLMVAKD
jgi:uncharacterized protein YqjF (DUF2071 family)